MKTETKSTFTIADWKDEPVEESGGGAKLTRTRATQAYEGAIVGQGVAEFLMCAGANGVTHFVGYERIEGSVDGKAGSFIIQHTGIFAGEPRSSWVVVAGSGVGELAGLAGEGSYAVEDGGMKVLFIYQLVRPDV